MSLSYTTVIVTRNRPEALALALPLHLAQSRLPKRILIIDSSDDASMNADLVDRWNETGPVPIIHQSAPSGLALQRNIGLKQVDTDVVFFPDDDSMVHPGALARIMQIYERDTAGLIGGVCGMETAMPPPQMRDGQVHDAYRMRRKDRFKALFQPLRTRIEDRLFPDPMKLISLRLQSRLASPEPWLVDCAAERVAWMTGFRMSFRTEAIRAVGFDEDLGRYALFEDVDAGLRVLARGYSLVAAREARVYHHKAPETRTGGRRWGVIHILNRAYISARSGQLDQEAVAVMRRHARYKIAQYRLSSRSPYGRERLAGAQAAYRALDPLLAAPAEGRTETYLRLRQSCIDGMD